MKLLNKEEFLRQTLLNSFKTYETLNIVDATCGNGHDSLFLAKNFISSNIYSIDIQQEAINNTKLLCKEYNINTCCIDHFKFFKDSQLTFDIIIFNTGFLPNSESLITTDGHNTVRTLEEALSKLNIGGLIAITIYNGHDNFEEENIIIKYLKKLNKYKHIVFTYQTLNTLKSPNLYIIERKK